MLHLHFHNVNAELSIISFGLYFVDSSGHQVASKDGNLVIGFYWLAVGVCAHSCDVMAKTKIINVRLEQVGHRI